MNVTQHPRLGFAGTPHFAAAILNALLQAGRPPVVVYTQPDRPAGRGRKVQPCAVKTLALNHGLTLRQPRSLRSAEEVAALEALDLDVLVVAAYGLLLPPAVLKVPHSGCINVHASLLPRWRGAAPIERAIMAGDSETGACIMKMDEGLDTGPVYLCRRCPIGPATDAPALERHLAEVGSEALLHCLEHLADLVPTPQPDAGVTYASKLTRADAQIDWHKPAIDIARQVRALRGRMPPFTELAGTQMNILEADALGGSAVAPGTIIAAAPEGIRIACGSGILNVHRLRLNVGKGQPLAAADAVNGYGRLLAPGAVFGPPAQERALESGTR